MLVTSTLMRTTSIFVGSFALIDVVRPSTMAPSRLPDHAAEKTTVSRWRRDHDQRYGRRSGCSIWQTFTVIPAMRKR